MPLKVIDSGSKIQPLSSNSAIDQSLPLNVSDSSSQTQSAPSNSAVDQSHLLDVSSSSSKPDFKAADKVLGYSRKNPNRRGRGSLGYTFLNTLPPSLPLFPGIFHFSTLSLEIPNKTKLNSWIFHKIVLEPLEVPRSKSKTPGNSTLYFLGYPWKFHFVFN